MSCHDKKLRHAKSDAELSEKLLHDITKLIVNRVGDADDFTRFYKIC